MSCVLHPFSFLCFLLLLPFWLYWFHFGCPSLPCLCDLPIGQDPFTICRTFFVLVSSFAHSVISSLCWKSQLFKNSPPSLLCRSLQMFLNPISFTAPLSFALPLSSLAQLSCAFCKKSMKDRPSKARKENRTRPSCSAGGWKRNPNWSANLSIPWGSKAPWRSHDGWAWHRLRDVITLNKGGPNLVCHVFFWEAGILHPNMSWPRPANLAVLCGKLFFPHKNANTIKHTHKDTKTYTKTLKNTTKNIILHTTYHPVPSKTHPSFSLNPVNSTPFAYTAWFPSLPDLWSHDPYHEAKPTTTWRSTSNIPWGFPSKGDWETYGSTKWCCLLRHLQGIKGLVSGCIFVGCKSFSGLEMTGQEWKFSQWGGTGAVQLGDSRCDSRIFKGHVGFPPFV